ncbi:MAG: hypothetical protein EBR82_38610 [Caulobacteraceae bacterium]|nr:hypothetical protein [Caulobacteraceae bacterium]
MKTGQAVSVQRLRSNPSLSGSKSTQPAVRSRTAAAGDFLCAWHIGDGVWHIQSRDAWLSKVLREAKLRRIAYAVIGGHLTIWETEDFEAMRPLMRRHKGRILR